MFHPILFYIFIFLSLTLSLNFSTPASSMHWNSWAPFFRFPIVQIASSTLQFRQCPQYDDKDKSTEEPPMKKGKSKGGRGKSTKTSSKSKTAERKEKMKNALKFFYCRLCDSDSPKYLLIPCFHVLCQPCRSNIQSGNSKYNEER